MTKPDASGPVWKWHIMDDKTMAEYGPWVRYSDCKTLFARAEKAEAERDTAWNDAIALIEIVEGIKGSMKHGCWRDENGRRLKDTDEWVSFYVTSKGDTP